ncbi:MAG: hypothetical protein ACNA8K_10110 [Cyclonatronaceae bacterium]
MRDPQAGGMLQGTALSTDNYDQTLIGWSGQQLQSDIEFLANGLTYCASEQARQSIIDTYGWTFTSDKLLVTSRIVLSEGAKLGATSDKFPNHFAVQLFAFFRTSRIRSLLTAPSMLSFDFCNPPGF